MELVLSAISSGGLTGIANQYLFLLMICLGGRFDLIRLSPEMAFMESWVFIGVVGFLWLLSVATAYSSLFAPGVANVINAISNFVNGFVVPASSALIALAAVGVIVEFNPELENAVKALQIFNPDGGLGQTGLFIAGGSALTASILTGGKALAKPALSTSSGTAGHASAPIFATVENVAALLMAGLFYWLSTINPWLLVVLLAIVAIITFAVLIYALYQLRRLGKGLGRVLRLIETHPRAGLAIVAESVLWGSGSLTWNYQNRGVLRLTLWLAWLIVLLLSLPTVILFVFLLVVGVYVGMRSGQSLLRLLEKDGHIPSASAGDRVLSPSAPA